MTASFPDVDMPITVEAAFGADPDASPAGWSFTDLSDLLADETITKRDGREPGATEADAKSCSIALLNESGDLTPLFAESPYYPNITLDLPMRVKVNPTGTPTEWAAGWATSWQPDFISTTDGVQTAIVRVELAGILQRLSQGKRPLRSALYRTMAGVAPNDYVPWVYHPLEDGEGATAAASGLANGTPIQPTGLTYAAVSPLVGSAALPTIATGGRVWVTVPTYANGAQFVQQWVQSVSSEPAAETVMWEVNTVSPERTYRLSIAPGSPSTLYLRTYTGGALESTATMPLDGTSGPNATEAGFYGNTFLFGMSSSAFGSSIAVEVKMYDSSGAEFLPSSSLGQIVASTTTGRVVGYGVQSAGAGLNGGVVGHPALYVDTAFNVATDQANNAAALNAYTGETAGRRAERLCREEGVLLYTTGDLDDTTTMGPQASETLLVNLRECEAVGGILGERGFGLHYITQGARYGLAVDLTIDLSSYRTTAGSEEQVLRPTYDNKAFRNQWTVDRPDGSTATVRVGAKQVYENSTTVNVETDEQVPDQASWRANRDAVDTLRYPNTPIDLAANPSLIDDWLTIVPGLGRVKRTNLPDGHQPDAIDELVDGFSENLTRRSWMVGYSGSPAFVYDVAELDDADTARLDTDGAYLSAAATSSGTTFQVATATGTSPLWTASGGEVPFDLLVGGEQVTATAVAAPTTITYGAVGTATHASNASVTPGIPASVAAGNLLIVVAAIRNSGTGVPDTPSGYSRLPVFASTDNVQVFAKVAVGGDAAPTITFTGGVANATTSAQMIRIAGAFSDPDDCFVTGQSQLNSSAQDIAYPALLVAWPAPEVANCFVVYLGWKQDGFTSVATISGATEIAEASTTTGDDQSLVWDYVIQTTATNIREGSFAVTGGASAISRGAVFAVRSNVQAVTVTRSVNDVTKAQTANTAVAEYRPARLAL